MDIITKYFSDFTAQQLAQLKALENLYKEWNEKINVISRKDIDGLYEKHVLHSLAIAAVFDFKAGTEIIDIGTGGGFPGIPLAIFFPHVNFLLADSIAKKLKVVDAVAAEIGLKNVTTRHIRAEEIKDRKFDFAVSRAVAPLKDLLFWSKPLIRKNKTIVGSQKSIEKPDEKSLPVSLGLATHDARLTTHDSAPGLICLKGGDLGMEIQESGSKPYITDIETIFPEPWFKEKYLLYVPKK